MSDNLLGLTKKEFAEEVKLFCNRVSCLEYKKKVAVELSITSMITSIANSCKKFFELYIYLVDNLEIEEEEKEKIFNVLKETSLLENLEYFEDVQEQENEWETSENFSQDNFAKAHFCAKVLTKMISEIEDEYERIRIEVSLKTVVREILSKYQDLKEVLISSVACLKEEDLYDSLMMVEVVMVLLKCPRIYQLVADMLL